MQSKNKTPVAAAHCPTQLREEARLLPCSIATVAEVTAEVSQHIKSKGFLSWLRNDGAALRTKREDAAVVPHAMALFTISLDASETALTCLALPAELNTPPPFPYQCRPPAQ
jgi:hypothetical protein